MDPARPPRSTFISTLTRENLICLIIGIPALAYVMVTNHTASIGVIALHAALLGALTPVAVTLIDIVLPRPRRLGWFSMLRDLAVRVIGLLIAGVGMVGAITHTTTLTLPVLIGGPLLVAMVPIILAYCLVAIGVQWAALREHALRVENQETRARQAALSARIRPHFLFNALNCIEELTDTDPPTAREAVGRLARLLRAVLQASVAPKGILADEVRLVEDYWAIEQLRFGKRLICEVDVDPAVARAELPTTILLTLAENAVKHGVETTHQAAQLQLKASPLPGGGVQIRLTGTVGPAVAPRAEVGPGYGLSDVRERLALAYRGRATLALRIEEGVSYVDLILPK